MSSVLKTCKRKDCAVEFQQYNSLQSYCSFFCKKKDSKQDISLKPLKPIKKVSDKRKVENLKYSVLRIEFLGKEENSICFIEGCNAKATTIEHRCGRWGSNFLDTITWAGCCLTHNLELENNPELSKKYQFSKITGKPKI